MRRTKNRTEDEAQASEEQPLYRPCKDCGCAVTDELAPVEKVYSEGLIRLVGPEQIARPHDYPQVNEVSICRPCAQRQERAAELVDSHRRAVPYLVSRSLRVEAANSAMIAFEMLGMTWRELFDGGTDRQVHTFIESLRAAGGNARYSLCLVPLVQPGFDQPVPLGVERWWHVTDPQRQAIRDAYGAYLADRIDGPIAVPVPESGYGKPAMRGCMFCGVGSVVVPSRRITGTWGDMRRVPSQLVGGRIEPEPRRGYLCPDCRKAADRMGMGQNAVDLAIATFHGLSREEFERIDASKTQADNQQGFRMHEVHPLVDNDDIQHTAASDQGVSLAYEYLTRTLPAWCALPMGTPPNRKPWQHLGDLSELRAALQKL